MYSLTAHYAEIDRYGGFCITVIFIITGFLKKRPGFRDHLSNVTTFVTSLGLSLNTGLTVNLSRSLYLYFNYLVSVTAGGPASPRGHMKPSSTVVFGWFVAFWEHQIFAFTKLIEIVILWVYYTIPFGVSLIWHFLENFQLLKPLCSAKDHWWGFITRNEHMVHIIN